MGGGTGGAEKFLRLQMKKRLISLVSTGGSAQLPILEATHGHLTPQLPLPPFSAPVELFMLVAVCLLTRGMDV